MANFNFIDRFTNLLFGSDRFYRQTQGYWVEEIGNSSATYIDFSDLEKVYLEIPQLRSIIDMRAALLMSSEWYLFDANGKRIERSPLLDLLENPNPLQSGDDFLCNLSIQEDIYGNAFVNMNKGTFGLPKSMYVLPNKGVEIKPTGKIFRQNSLDEIVSYYKFCYNDIEDKFTTDEIIHFKQSDVGLILGKSKVETLQKEISNIKAAMDSRNVMIKERGAIGLIAPDGKEQGSMMTPDEKRLAELQNQEIYGIGKDQRRVKIMSSPVKWIPTVINTKELMLFEEIESNFNVMCDVYGIKSELFSKVKGSTFNNYKESLKAAYQNMAIPRANAIAAKMSKRLCTNGQYLELIYKVPALEENNLESVQAEAEMAQMLSLLNEMDMTYDELREIINNGQNA